MKKREVVVEDGTKITYIPHASWERLPIVQAFAIGDHAVTGDEDDVWDLSDEACTNVRRDVKNWGMITRGAEGIVWCRGWEGEAAVALRAAAALALKDNQTLYEHKSRDRT